MRINRMFEIIYMLLDEEQITASELARRFEVSTRTIYRDIENISAAGIPIYMSRGKNGGISLAKGYIIDKKLLSNEERASIISALSGFHLFNEDKSRELIKKLGLFFGEDQDSYIEIDLMDWGDRVKNAYGIIKRAIQEKRILEFDYISPDSGISSRKVEPYKLYFKSSTWYLKCYCLKKKSERLFRLSRMKNIVLTESFTPRVIEGTTLDESKAPKLKLKLLIDKSEEYRVLDEFKEHEVLINADGNYVVETEMIHSNWVVGYLLSYGSKLTVIYPEEIRDTIVEHIQGLSKNYL